MPTLASALRVLQRRLTREGVGTAEEFVQLQVDAPGFIASLFSSDAFQAEAEAETAAMVARSIAEAQADEEAAALQADLDAARAAAEEARAEAAAVDSRAAAQVEAARAEAEAARAEVEVAKAEAEAAIVEARAVAQADHVMVSTAEAMLDEAMAMVCAAERRMRAAQNQALCELKVLCSEVAAADRAACELEVLRSEVAAAEERERGMANAETTIGFFAELVAERLQPLFEHPAEALNGEGEGSTSSGEGEGSSGEGEGSTSSGEGEGSSGEGEGSGESECGGGGGGGEGSAGVGATDAFSDDGEYSSPFHVHVDMDELLSIPALSLQEPFASEVLNGDKTVESRGADFLKCVARQGGLLAIRRGIRGWNRKYGEPLRSGPCCPDGCVAGVVVLGPTCTKSEMARLLGGRDSLAAAVGLPYEAIRRYCTQLAAPVLLPSPFSYAGPLSSDGWKGVVLVTASREQWGEEVWRAAQPPVS
jgi:hypothetical protein